MSINRHQAQWPLLNKHTRWQGASQCGWSLPHHFWLYNIGVQLHNTEHIEFSIRRVADEYF